MKHQKKRARNSPGNPTLFHKNFDRGSLMNYIKPNGQNKFQNNSTSNSVQLDQPSSLLSPSSPIINDANGDTFLSNPITTYSASNFSYVNNPSLEKKKKKRENSTSVDKNQDQDHDGQNQRADSSNDNIQYNKIYYQNNVRSRFNNSTDLKLSDKFNKELDGSSSSTETESDELTGLLLMFFFWFLMCFLSLLLIMINIFLSFSFP